MSFQLMASVPQSVSHPLVSHPVAMRFRLIASATPASQIESDASVQLNRSRVNRLLFISHYQYYGYCCCCLFVWRLTADNCHLGCGRWERNKSTARNASLLTADFGSEGVKMSLEDSSTKFKFQISGNWPRMAAETGGRRGGRHYSRAIYRPPRQLHARKLTSVVCG